MSLKLLEWSDHASWDGFLDEIQPHTFLQGWAWGDFQIASGVPIFRFGFTDDSGKLTGVALVLHVKARRGSFLFCPHGPIVRDLNEYPVMLEILQKELRQIAKANHCAFVRFSPLLLDSSEHRSWFKDLGFRSAPTHMHPELAWMLDLTPSEDELLLNMRKTTRYCIKRAEKDEVLISSAADEQALESFWEVYHSTAQRQNFTPFSKHFLRTELETFAKSNQISLFSGSHQGVTISTAMVVFANGSAFYHQGASDPTKFPKIAASYPVLWAAICEAKRRGCRWFNFWGVVPEDQVKHPWAGLSQFKRGFGGFEEAYVHAQDDVIQARYWLTWLIEEVRRRRRKL